MGVLCGTPPASKTYTYKLMYKHTHPHPHTPLPLVPPKKRCFLHACGRHSPHVQPVSIWHTLTPCAPSVSPDNSKQERERIGLFSRFVWLPFLTAETQLTGGNTNNACHIFRPNKNLGTRTRGNRGLQSWTPFWTWWSPITLHT